MIPASPPPPGATTPAPPLSAPWAHRLPRVSRGSRPRGFTLLELMTVMILLGLTLGRIYPAGQKLLDRMAVRGAREGAVGLFHRARMEAVARGGVRILLETDPPALAILPLASAIPIVEMALDQGVELHLTRDRSSAELQLDAMGLGRVASQTLRFSRGSSWAELVVSSFGRVTRR